MKITKVVFALLAVFVMCRPLVAQSREAIAKADDEPPTALRPFVIATGEAFAAKETFKAAFGQAVETFYGGGLEFVTGRGPYLDIAASRFKRTGQRAFRANGQNFGLGIPLTVTMTPIEVTGGYRFGQRRRIIPYLGAGIGSYRYKETAGFSDPGEDTNTRKTGYIAAGGAEVRVTHWLGVAGDVQYTRVLGILGAGGISKEAGERDLGGVTVRLKITVGR